MKKRLAVLGMAVALCMTGNVWSEVKAAEEVGIPTDFSYLLGEDTLVGYAVPETRGVYLMGGTSALNKESASMIGVGGETRAKVVCEVHVATILERKTSTGWARVGSWSKTNENETSATVARYLTVDRGNYYRVRSSHYANSDVASSYTDALWMAK